jgi:hypothetical protein
MTRISGMERFFQRPRKTFGKGFGRQPLEELSPSNHFIRQPRESQIVWRSHCAPKENPAHS